MNTDRPPIRITPELTEAEALAYAQFVKRSRWDTYRSLAVDDSEARLMQDAETKIRKALAEAGYAPR